jgi:hypothetical protein
MPISFGLALVGLLVAVLAGVGLVCPLPGISGWDLLTYAVFAMLIAAGGLVATVLAAGFCAIRHPAWRRRALGILGAAIAGGGLLAFVWVNA